MHPILEDFLNRRRALGISQAELAEQSGVSISLISKIEAGFHSNPTLDIMEKLGTALTKLENGQNAGEGKAA